MLSSIFIFLLLCLSMHACNARLSAMLVHPTSTDTDAEKVDLGMDSVQGGGTEGNMFRSHQNTKPEDSKTEAVGYVKEMKLSRKETSDHDHIPGVNFVPIKNHHHHHDNKNLGFYSDYSRPRTRPPSHN